MADNRYCLILAGGNGSRLWPISRTIKPKQFLDLFGTGRTLLQQTYDRVAKFIDPEHIYVSTNVAYLPLVYEQLPEVDDMLILGDSLHCQAESAGNAFCYVIRPDYLERGTVSAGRARRVAVRQ